MHKGMCYIGCYLLLCHLSTPSFCLYFYHFLFLELKKLYLVTSELTVQYFSCHMNLSSYLLLCLSEGDAEGEGTEVRGVGTGHVRTGSSRMLSFSISSIIYSTDTWKQRRIKKMDDEADKMKAMWIKGKVKICQEDGNNEQKGHRVEEVWRSIEEGERERKKSFQRHFTRSI